jgi:hypothetical protein
MVQVGLGLAEDQPHAAEQPSGLGEDPSRNEMEFTEDPPQVLWKRRTRTATTLLFFLTLQIQNLGQLLNQSVRGNHFLYS